ncbi:MAG TPA: hypothetical protein VJ063_14925, partial [Verrucomicrobiae bacterium]|nr:hypothetical protein [Verrucomicrobiae bacterium]
MSIRRVLSLILLQTACLVAGVLGGGSPFYDIQVIARPGAALGDGNTIATNHGEWYENLGDRGQPCQLLTVDAYLTEFAIPEFVSINDAGQVAFNALVNRPMPEGWAQRPSAMVVSWSPVNGQLSSVECGIIRNGSVTVLSDGTVFPRLGGLVRLTDTSGYFVQSWSSQADDGTVAFAGNYSEFHTAPDPEPHFVIDRYDTDIFLIRGTPGSWTQLGPLPSQCEGVVGACFGGRIEIANDHSVLVNEGDEHSASQGLEGPYVRYDGAGTRRVLYSVGTGGWQRFSRKPGLSRDGKAIAFVGQRADGGAGVFLHILDPSVPELANSNCIVSCGLPLALDEDGNPITFSELDLYTSPCVIHHDVGGDGNIVGDSFIVVFKGTPSRGSRANPVDPTKPLLFSGEEGLWTARVDVERELQAPTVVVLNTRGVLPVAQIGDVIGGETITYLQVWRGLGRGTAGLTGSPRQTIDSRPSPGDHYLGFWADTANGPMVLRAAHLDTDNDGLLDHWEREGGGIDIDRDGTIDLALSDFGANVRHKDIFLEIDWTAPRTNGYPGGWRNEPYPGALRSLTNAFARAPVHNPDGADGITLHVDAGAEFDRRGHPFSQNLSGTSLALLQGGDRVRMADGQHPDVIYFGAPHDPGVPTLRSRSLHEVKDLYFGTTDKRARELAFHYCVMGDWSDARGYAQSGPLQTTLNMIGVFGNGFTLPNSSTGTNAPTFVKAEAGDWVMVVSGTGAGQIRQVRGVFTEEDGATSFLIENPRFDPVPEDGAQFVILPRSTGESEIGVRGPATGDDLANQHTLPGNDIILSVATRGRGSWGIIGDRESHWRTLMHEMGHNLGLRHGGNDADCEYRGDVYWSLMSYSHQLRTSVEALGVGGETCQGYPDGDPSTPGMQVFRIDPPPPGIAPTSPIPGVVMSYSDGTDPLGFNEWAYIRMDLWRTLPFVGNSLRFLNGALPDIHQTSPSPEDASPPRTETPTIQITMPAPSESVPIGAMLNVTAMVHHDVPLDTVIATFDVNGDTNISAAEIRVASQTGAAGGASEYQVSFPAVTGLAGTRVLRVQAHDIEGNGSIAEANIAVGATSPDDLYAPYGSFTEPQYNGRVSLDRPLFVEVAAADDETRVESVWIRFDRNGDGAAEFTLAEPVDEYHYQAMIPNVTGSVGTRTLSLIVFDIWRNAMTNSMPVNVRPLDVTRPQIQITAPLDGTAAPLESIVRVRGVVTDNSPVSYVNVIFDLDGNGTSEIVYAPVSNGTNFTAVLGDFAMRVRGPLGPRSIRVEALDEANNRGFTSIAVEVVDGSGPSIELLSPLNEAVVALGVPFIVAANVADDQAVNGVLVAADIDGNGAIEEGPETRAASRISGARYEASFGPLAGPEGARQLTITAWDP